MPRRKGWNRSSNSASSSSSASKRRQEDRGTAPTIISLLEDEDEDEREQEGEKPLPRAAVAGGENNDNHKKRSGAKYSKGADTSEDELEEEEEEGCGFVAGGKFSDNNDVLELLGNSAGKTEERKAHMLEQIKSYYKMKQQERKRNARTLYKADLTENLKKVHSSLKASRAALAPHAARIPHILPGPLEIPVHQPEHWTKAGILKNKLKFSFAAQVLTPQKPIPHYCVWIPIQRNITVEDETVLRHLPYIGDDDPDGFLEDLAQDYEDHLVCDEEIYDDGIDASLVEFAASLKRIFPDLMIPPSSWASLREELNSEVERLQSEKTSRKGFKGSADKPHSNMAPVKTKLAAHPSLTDPLVVSNLFFINLSEAMGRSVSSKNLKTRYTNIVNSLRVESTHGHSATDPDGLGAPGPIDAEKMMDTYHSLFCRRCFMYDCRLHSTRPLPTNTSVRPSSHVPSSVPCSSTCYLLQGTGSGSQPVFTSTADSVVPPLKRKRGPKPKEVPSKVLKIEELDESPLASSSTPSFLESTSLHPRPSPPSSSTPSLPSSSSLPCQDLPSMPSSSTAMPPSPWDSREEAFFTKAHHIFGRDFCAIARFIGTKSCGEVHQYAVLHCVLQDIHGDVSAKASHPTKKKGRSKVLKALHQAQKIGDGHVYSYTPCDHVGPCTDECPCVSSNNFCQKFCQCFPSCKNAFEGCRCRSTCDTRQCPCFAALRECDPDLCRTCGADQFDGLNTHVHANCHNVSIQRRLHKHLLLAPSDVAGWGIFTRDPIQKNEFVSEYCGEIISQEEADRRGKVYDKYMCSFLFNLNQDYVVDATRKGNKIRFANHALNPNCYARVMMVNGDHRIGIFAKHAIPAGKELFFDYRYGPTDALRYVGVERDELDA